MGVYTTWREYGGGPSSSKYVSFEKINKTNVNQLKIAWTYQTKDSRRYEFNPIIIDSTMYVLAKNNSLVALNATTGKEIWIHTDLQGIAGRGINYWENSSGKDKRLIFQMNGYLQEIDAVTGKTTQSFGNKGVVDLRRRLGRDPKRVNKIQSKNPGKIFKNLFIVGSSTGEKYMSVPGFIRAYNVITGKLVWTFHTIPQPGEFGYDTWPKGAYKYVGGVNAWGEMSLDKKREIIYVPLGSPTYDFYGADRIGKNLFSDCLVALDANTGKRIWHFQMTHHDLWDYDLTAAPQLVTVNHEGKNVDVVAQATKQGFLFIFNRATGEPLWPINEKRVPPSHVPGEQVWPTQPFPTVLPLFARQSIQSKDVTSLFVSKKQRLKWKKRIDSSQTGLYKPLSDIVASIFMPGTIGGANWGMTASNPDNGMVYVYTLNGPSILDGPLKKWNSPKDNNGHQVDSTITGKEVFMKNCKACHAADRRGSGFAPTLVDLGKRFSLEGFSHVVSEGRGKMPSFSYLRGDKVEKLYKFLTQGHVKPNAKGKEVKGPVVASGGAIGGQLSNDENEDKKGSLVGPPYPVGLDVPPERYYLESNGLDHPPLFSPPWSSIVAYDLNKGTIKWRRPIGNIKSISDKTGSETGVPRANRKGMIVTSSGLLFSTAGGRHIYAFDTNNGKKLWSAKLPMGTKGLPAMYEVNRRQYLVACATIPRERMDVFLEESLSNQAVRNTDKIRSNAAYIVFSLPK